VAREGALVSQGGQAEHQAAGDEEHIGRRFGAVRIEPGGAMNTSTVRMVTPFARARRAQPGRSPRPRRHRE
jgi:hypothetical protein